jgi:hypothetical protein
MRQMVLVGEQGLHNAAVDTGNQEGEEQLQLVAAHGHIVGDTIADVGAVEKEGGVGASLHAAVGFLAMVPVVHGQVRRRADWPQASLLVLVAGFPRQNLEEFPSQQ